MGCGVGSGWDAGRDAHWTRVGMWGRLLRTLVREPDPVRPGWGLRAPCGWQGCSCWGSVQQQLHASKTREGIKLTPRKISPHPGLSAEGERSEPGRGRALPRERQREEGWASSPGQDRFCFVFGNKAIKIRWSCCRVMINGGCEQRSARSDLLCDSSNTYKYFSVYSIRC